MTTPSITVNLAVTAQGAQPTAPATLWTNLITLVAAEEPGYTVLPGGLIEDLASTATYALALIDAGCVELINSLDPFVANPWLLVQLGNIYGVPRGQDANAQVFAVFTGNSGSAGFQIPPGWIVSDGNNQYVVQDGSVIPTGLVTDPVFCVCTTAGVFPIPANTVTQTVTQPPAGSGITLTVTNPLAGTPSPGPQTEADYRVQVLQAGLVSSQGTQRILRTLLGNVPGVQPRLVSVRLGSGAGTGWEVICGGGDPYVVANAIYSSGIDLSTLIGSETIIETITNANPGVAKTNIDHGFHNGDTIVISGVTGTTGVNGSRVVTVISPTQFSFGVDTTASGAYTGGGTVTPNSGIARNVTVNLNDYPDTYPVVYVSPLGQPAVVQLTWDTTSPNFVNDTAVAQLGAPAIANYLNSLPVGAPINLNAMGAAFTAAVIELFGGNLALISEMQWAVSISGTAVSPVVGTFLVEGDPEGYFTASASSVTITQA